MLVTFTSSETGEILMFADAAKELLGAIGKETTAKGTFTQAEMAGAAAALRQASQLAEPAPEEDLDVPEERRQPVVVLGQRAWPLIDMLERTAKGGPKANIVWQAAAAF
ncbi:MAG: DUF1840 domain-containing protein [Azonexus sp.]|nr:DUF1840 domain-containing protein [Azonexus sp.]